MKFLLLLLTFLITAAAAEIRVAAAASLGDVVAEIAAAYEKAHGTQVVPVFAGSNVLARQIREGAPLDVFIPADEATMKQVEQAGLVDEVTPLLTNSLVVVVPVDSPVTLRASADLAAFRRIAIGDPAAVPAGVYAKRWLTKAGLWEGIAPRCVGSENVRGALAAVEAGNAEAAIVYRTDADRSKKVKVAWSAPAEEAPRIVYPVAVCRGTKQPDAARRFAGFLKSAEAAKIFAAHGFGLVEK